MRLKVAVLSLFKKKNAKQGERSEKDEHLSDEIKENKPSGLFQRLRQGLTKTRSQLGDGLSKLLLGRKQLDDELFEEIETLLLLADVGVDTTKELIESLSGQLKRKELKDGEAVLSTLKKMLINKLRHCEEPLQVPHDKKPYVILMVGINGAGKTTTIGKLAHRFKHEGKRVMLAAGDTFRAAACEQLKAWGERHDVPVISQHTGADSASVIFDALQAAKARNVDVLIADTAGRLHTQNHLMEELKKIKRVLAKIDDEAPHETMLVLDASIGQNAISQAKEFHEAVRLTGVTMTKLDGSAKGGVLFAIANELQLPFRYIGVGEQSDDLRPFQAEDFIKALFD